MPVPGGTVNAAGGNLVVERTDLAVDTRLGSLSVGATYNSQTNIWLWDFDVTYDGTTFVDTSGAVYDVSGLAAGDPIPGSVWEKRSTTSLKTRGGLRHDFDATSYRLLRVRRGSAAYPRLEYVQGTVGGATRTTAIQQCTAPGVCLTLFTIAYDAQGRVIRIDDLAGRTADFAYDAAGDLMAARDGLDVEKVWPGFRYDYTATKLTAITNSEGERIEIDYEGVRVKAIRPIGEENPVHGFTYQKKVGGLYSTVYTDPLGFQTLYWYDDARQVHSIQNALAETIQYTWANRRPLSQTLPDGVTTSWSYENDYVATETQPSGNVVQFSYEPGGVNRDNPLAPPIATIQDGLGSVETRSYDAEGRHTGTANGAAETTTLTYGTDEALSSITTPAGVVTSFLDYAEAGMPRQVTAFGSDRFFDYDAVGNSLAGDDFAFDVTPGEGGLVARRFDGDRNPTELDLVDQYRVFLVTGATVLTEFRSDGQPIRITRPYGGDTEYLYDSLGRLVERRERASGVGHADWQSTTFEYDAMGRQTAMERPNGMREERAYDAAGRVQAQTLKRGGVVESSLTHTYVDGRLSSVQDTVHGTAESYAYDAAGRVIGTVFPGGESVWTAYDVRSRIVAVSYLRADLSLLRALQYEYDSADRQIAVSDDGDDILRRTYQAGRLTLTSYGNGLERSVEYDAETGQPTGYETRAGPGGALVETTTYQRASGPLSCLSEVCFNAATQTFGQTPVTTVEDYQVGSRIDGGMFPNAGARIVEGPTPVGSSATAYFDFDHLSNLKGTRKFCSQTGDVGSIEMVYNSERNRLLEVRWLTGCSGQIHSYAYDEAGFVSDRDGVPFDWNAAGRLQRVGSDIAFVWDSLGRPVSRTVMGVTTTWLFGGAVEADSAGAPTALDLGDVRIDLVTGDRLYRHSDFRGNVKFVTDDVGAVTAHYRYGAYGRHELYGSASDPYRFAQGFEALDLVLLGGRPLDADAGAFLAPDPIYQLINQYSYTIGNPVWFWDPNGLQSVSGNGATLQGISNAASNIAFVAGTAAAIFAVVNPPVAAALTGIAIGAGGLSFAINTAQSLNNWKNSSFLPDIRGGAKFLMRTRDPRSRALRTRSPSMRAGGSSGGSSIGPGGSLGGGGSCGLGFELVVLVPLMRRAWERRAGHPRARMGG